MQLKSFMAQNGRKDVVKIVHVTSEVQPWCYKATRIIFEHKENKNSNFSQEQHCDFVFVCPVN